MINKKEAIDELINITHESREKINMLFVTICEFDSEIGENVLSHSSESLLLESFKKLNEFEQSLVSEKNGG